MFHKLLYLINSKGLVYIMSKHNTHRWRASVQRRVHSILQQQLYQARAFLSLQPREQWAGRGRSEEHEISGREMQRRKESLGEAIAAWRNMLRNDGTTPAELFYGRKLRQNLPMLPITEKTDCDISSRDTTHTKQAQMRDRNTVNFKQLEAGQKVMV